MQCAEDSDDDPNGEIDAIIEQDRREKARKCRARRRRAREEPLQRDRSRGGKPPAVDRRPVQWSGVKRSRRFSLHVMEAMRAIGRDKLLRGRSRSTSSACEIVKYIESHFEADGDVDAQVRTVLMQLCCQGFVGSEDNDRYCLIGPYTRQPTPACPITPKPKTPSRRSCPDDDTCRRRRPRGAQEGSGYDLLMPSSARGGSDESGSDRPGDRRTSCARKSPAPRGQARRCKTPLRGGRTPRKPRTAGRRYGAEELVTAGETLNLVDGMETEANPSTDDDDDDDGALDRMDNRGRRPNDRQQQLRPWTRSRRKPAQKP